MDVDGRQKAKYSTECLEIMSLIEIVADESIQREQGSSLPVDEKLKYGGNSNEWWIECFVHVFLVFTLTRVNVFNHPKSFLFCVLFFFALLLMRGCFFLLY